MADALSDTDSDATYDPTEGSELSHFSQSCDPMMKARSDSKTYSEEDLFHNDKPGRSGMSPKDSIRKTLSKVHDISDSNSDSDEVVKVKVTENSKEQYSSKLSLSKQSRGQYTDSNIENSKVALKRDKTIVLENNQTGVKLPMCKYGSKCYRKNPSHFKEFRHLTTHGHSEKKRSSVAVDELVPNKKTKRESSTSSPPKNGQEIFQRSSPLNFVLLKVQGISPIHNQYHSISIKDILDPSMGNLQQSAQFNYMFEIPWLLEQYPAEFRKKPLLLIHGFQRQQKSSLDLEASLHDHVRLCQARLEIPYGTHHTKMMFLLYDNGMRVVIHTANLVQRDWHQKTQGAWLSPVFPKLARESAIEGDSCTHFKQDLLQYVRAYRARPLEDWINIIKQHDMSQAKVHIIGSVPGRHVADNKHSFGHLKLRKILQEYGPSVQSIKTWPVIGQFSSIGSLGAQREVWLCGEWYTSLSSAKNGGTSMGGDRDKLKLIFPSKDNVRTSLEGYPAGAALPYSINVAKKQTYLHSFFHQWKSAVRGRNRASPHIKTYCRMSPDAKQLAWFAVTSANLSKAAWGALEKNASQLMIRSYEIGVLFLPQHFGKEVFQTLSAETSESSGDSDGLVFPQPYDLPPVPYSKSDKPWIWDIAYTELPDSHGNSWCPP